MLKVKARELRPSLEEQEQDEVFARVQKHKL